MQILMNDFTREPEELLVAMEQAFSDVMRSGWYILGKRVESFESEWAQFCGTQFAVGVGNGLDAIEIMLRASGVGPGDEVITTSMTAFATVLGIIRAGATPVIADIYPENGLMSVESAERCVTGKTKAILLVHLYGQLGDMHAWKQFCEQHALLMFEDAAQAHGAQMGNKKAGTFGKAAAFSFYPTKNLGALGDAGMITTDDAEVYERSKRLRNYGQRNRYEHSDLGLNSRLDELQAALLSAKLRWLETFTRRRKEIAERYRAEITNQRIRLLEIPEEGAHVFHLFAVRCDQRDLLQAHLAQHKIQSLIHYPIPIHQQSCNKGFKTDPSGLIHAEQFSATCLSVPCHPQLSESEIVKIIQVMNAF
ncbi:MAG: DegT/DnrJ/EryC1/StrS family aminotransferase [Bacteroidia bacterium]|jgi:dTDP-4-amino-4,6-dideoxygalactose transaminase